MLEQYLQGLQGRRESTGTFTVAPDPSLGLSDVPLLMLAAAVEGNSPYFSVRGHLRFEYALLGPSARLAQAILRREGVDHEFREGALELPPAFEDFLEPLARRSRFAPLDLWWGDRRQPAWTHAVVVRRGSLSVVDRGLEFSLPLDLPIVAQVPPLPGAPWPRCLLWGVELERQVALILGEGPSSLVG